MENLKRNFTEPTVNPDQKKNAYLFETDESDVAVAASEFLIVALDYDGNEDIDIM